MKAGLTALFAAIAIHQYRYDRPQNQARRVCQSNYQNAHTAADSARYDGNHVLVKDRVIYIYEQTCGELRLAGKL